MAVVINMRKILLIVLLTIGLFGCKKEETYNQYRKVTYNAGFDTVFALVGYTKSEVEFDRYFKMMEQQAYEYHTLYDKYNDYQGINNIKTINDNAGIKAIEVDSRIIDLLTMAKEYYDLTDGYFDITIGAVLEKWHYCREQATNNGFGCVPTESELQEAYQHTGWSLVEIDTDANTVYLTDAQASLDVGGIAKGYVVEKIALSLEASGLKFGAVDGGGNIRTINQKPNDDPFTIGITNPDNRGNISVDILSLHDSSSFVTSGDYERYYHDEYGNRYHHIIDPFTLYPSISARSITIITPNSAIADILSTALYVMDYQTAISFLNDQNNDDISVIWLYDKDNHPDVEGIYVDEYFEIIYGNVITNNRK